MLMLIDNADTKVNVLEIVYTLEIPVIKQSSLHVQAGVYNVGGADTKL